MNRTTARRRATAVVALLLAVATLPAVATGPMASVFAALALCMLAAAIAIHDLATLLIPDRYILGILLVALADWWFDTADPLALLWRMGLASALMLVLWLFDLGYGLVRNRTGIGLGDIKLAGASAVLVGIAGVGTQIVLASVAAFAFIVIRSVRLRRPLRAAARVPFGAFLAPALVIVWAWLPAPW